MDASSPRGGAMIGARLRRLSERIDGEASSVYRAHGIDFEQRWFGVLNQLSLGGPLTVSQLAERLGITHASVSQTRQSLEKAGLVKGAVTPGDARSRSLALTARGRALVERLRPMWRAFEAAALELDTEAGGVAEALGRLEAALDRRSLVERIGDRWGVPDRDGEESA
ncbi:MarR family transcriptional regulator [Stigmatella sp. ncwal1]|uniref:MarR family transcriptional regulator n=1 Tax=Stigmatella ashevillensis TaxID=2995309 RepID=A0ABT5DIW9_9BACT|nr:MarR family transcriptional regulator [Stigmatella ashevillena]MDC0713524.1 MarR family transcriptional regulator [Stigmatella ashevillena]